MVNAQCGETKRFSPQLTMVDSFRVGAGVSHIPIMQGELDFSAEQVVTCQVFRVQMWRALITNRS